MTTSSGLGLDEADTAYWLRARAQMMLDPTVANLNTGSFGPNPCSVFECATRLRSRLAEEPMDFLVRQVPPLLWKARETLAAFLGGDATRLVFTANVSAAINVIAAGIRLAAPGEILITDHEYGAMQWCWERAARLHGLTLRTFSLPVMAPSPEEIVAAACSAFSDRTRLFFFSHVLSPTGMVLPARELCLEARRRGILTVVDGAHAPGLIPLNLSELACDFYCGNCHKWLLAPIGSGFLYVPHGSENRLQPLQVSWGWNYDPRVADRPDDFGSTPWLRSFEFEGTRDPCAWLAIPAAIEFQSEIGLAKIAARIGWLRRQVRSELAGACNLAPATPDHPELHAAMTAFWLPDGLDPMVLRQELWQRYRIEVPIIERPGKLLIRVSTHFFNTEEEIARLSEALQQILAGPK